MTLGLVAKHDQLADEEITKKAESAAAAEAARIAARDKAKENPLTDENGDEQVSGVVTIDGQQHYDDTPTVIDTDAHNKDDHSSVWDAYAAANQDSLNGISDWGTFKYEGDIDQWRNWILANKDHYSSLFNEDGTLNESAYQNFFDSNRNSGKSIFDNIANGGMYGEQDNESIESVLRYALTHGLASVNLNSEEGQPIANIGIDSSGNITDIDQLIKTAKYMYMVNAARGALANQKTLQDLGWTNADINRMIDADVWEFVNPLEDQSLQLATDIFSDGAYWNDNWDDSSPYFYDQSGDNFVPGTGGMDIIAAAMMPGMRVRKK